MKRFIALQESLRGWDVGYGGNPDRKIHWGNSFPSRPCAMEFIKKQAPGRLIVVMRETDKSQTKGNRSSDEHM